MNKRALITVLVITLTACAMLKPGQRVPTEPVRPTPTQSSPAHALPSVGTYTIDPAHSELRVLVYRAGALANLGHNHVILNRAISGSVLVGSRFSDSSFSLSVPAAFFVVDDAQARQEEGADFATEIPAQAKSGTLHNMLSAAVLDSAAHPALTMRSVAVAETQGALTASVALDVAGHESLLSAPFTLQADGQQLIVEGSLELRQSALGLMPYSLMLGALQVQDAMQVKFKFVALKH